MNTTPPFIHPAALVETLDRLGLSKMLTGFVPRQHVTRRVSWHEFERYVTALGYRVAREHGNIYGRLMLERTPTTPAPHLRVITKSDHAAVFGSKRRAA